MFWQEIQFRSRQEKALDDTDLFSLTHLYQPIVGVMGVGLYVTLHSQASKQETSALLTHTYLFKLLSISHNQLLEARYQLEGVGLLRTFEKSNQREGNYLEYQVISPLAPLTFFQTMPLAIQLQHRLGKDEYQLVKNQVWSEDKEIQSVNLTKSFQEVYGQKEATVPTQVIPATKKRKSNIDFGFIRSRLASIIKPAHWTSQLESELKQACYLFKLDESTLIKAIQNPEVSYGGHVNLEKLFHYLNTSPYSNKSVVSPTSKEKSVIKEPAMSPKEKHFQLLETISPFELLAHYQGGAAVPKSEMNLIQSLLTHYQLPAPVVNVLLDFVMLKCDRKLPKAYVEKIASHWKRLNIQTSEQAREQALKEHTKQPNQNSNTTKAKRRPSVKKLPKTIAREVIEPSFTDEELQGTYDDIQATMKFLRSTEKQVLHNKE
ncbi:DnaD domain protein [Shimazuella sp. AN120528]|uniref:DnaD domain protein n=1 Tax=Shimazuella soli TaxID=1892854 RepID=UPI001F0E048B|nr:DnaD domain protein [Shimazuella soli]MCH5584387.1 DnaD domain protein [Shimazuella soli]